MSARDERVEAIRGHHRATRDAGFVFCLLGVLAMVSGKYIAAVPAWATFAGLGLILCGWALFAYALFKRAALARRHVNDADS